MIWRESAPSNIALIKYMGKKDIARNIPDNPSLSLSLPHLITTVEIEKNDLDLDCWEPLKGEGYFPISLSSKGEAKFLGHFQFLKEKFQVQGFFNIKSANTFPGDCGLASSASSFAALTKVALKAFSEIQNVETLSIEEQASLSRIGSGSSCRSFQAPWVVWTEDEVLSVDFPQKKLIHMVVVVSGEKKKISSSEAHKIVKSSLLFKEREERARIRLGLLIEALSAKNWKDAFEICWSEFWDMHALFETSLPSFGYMNEKTFSVLQEARGVWRKIDDGPLVTMDAGPNVHFIFRSEQISMAESLKSKFESRGFQVLMGSVT